MSFAVSDPLDVLRKQVISLLPYVIYVDNDPTGVNPVVLTYPENYKNAAGSIDSETVVKKVKSLL